MDKFEFSFTDRVALFDGPSPWYYVELPKKDSEWIRREFRDVHRGWGSIPVMAQINDTSWKTSIFWEKKGQYLLFLKKEIRQKEKFTSGDEIEVKIELKP